MAIEISHNTIEEHVRDLYQRLNIREPYQIDRFEISRKLNIHLHDSDLGSRAGRIGDWECVMLHKGLTEQQKHAQFFHELAHIRIHTGSQHRMSKAMYEYQEWRAERFMLHCLAPTDMLLRDGLYRNENEALYFLCERYNVCEEHARKRFSMFLR